MIASGTVRVRVLRKVLPPHGTFYGHLFHADYMQAAMALALGQPSHSYFICRGVRF